MRTLTLLLALAACASAPGTAPPAAPHADAHGAHTGAAEGPRAPAAASPAPPGWLLLSNPPGAFQARVDRTVAHGGSASGLLRGEAGAAHSDFGSLLQSIRADEYRGERVRLSAQVRTRGVGAETGLWMRVDGKGTTLAFDNMQLRAISGDTEWTRHEVVLDVPPGSAGILFGAWLHGAGEVWIDDVRLETVGPEVPPTVPAAADREAQDPAKVRQQEARYAGLGTRPVNLGFEQEG